MKNFLNDESGVIISAELVLVLTICVIGVIVGLSHVAMAVNEELHDLAAAIGKLDQTYWFNGYRCCKVSDNVSGTNGSRFNDGSDHCDCSTSCDLVSEVGSTNSAG